MKALTNLFFTTLKTTTALTLLAAAVFPATAMDYNLRSTHSWGDNASSAQTIDKEGFEEIKVNFQICGTQEDIGNDVSKTGNNFTIVTGGKNATRAPYVLKSDDIEFQEGDILRVLYEVEVIQGGASIGMLSSTTKNWVQDLNADPSEDEKYPTMHRTFLAAPRVHKGVFARTASARETGASVIFRSFHARENNDISIFTIMNPKVFRKGSTEPGRVAIRNFMNRPFDTRNYGVRVLVDSRNPAINRTPKDYDYCDIGYGQGRARTDQYQGLALPTAPVLHPYHPAQPLVAKGFEAPAFAMNIKLPGLLPDFGPAVLHGHLAGMRPENIDTFIIFQDTPWYDDVRQGPEDDALRADEPELKGYAHRPLQLKPQYWLEPNAPNTSPTLYNHTEHTYIVRTGVFSKQYPNVQIRGQQSGGLFEEREISVHNAGPGTALISSGSVLSIDNLNLNRSQVLYSLTKHVDKVTGVERRAAVVKHVLLNQADQQGFETLVTGDNVILSPCYTLRDLKNRMVNMKKHHGQFQDLDIDEIF